MACRTCDELLDAYQRSFRLFRDAVWKVAAAQGPESRATVQEMNRLQQTCRDANAALNEHMRQAHSRNEGLGPIG
jgi:hypothetical protein